MKKYILRIEDEPCNYEDGKKYYMCADASYWRLSEDMLNRLPKFSDELEKGLQSEYQRGLNDAWECARKIASGVLWSEHFNKHGHACASDVLDTYSAQEAIAKMAECEIKIGDELEQITNSGNPTGVSCIVTNIGDDKFNGITEDGKAVVCASQIYRWWRKTGRTFPQIEEVLKAMQRGES